MWVVYSIADDGETRVVGITVIWSIVYHNPTIGDIPPAYSGDIVLVDEKDGVCAFV